MSAIALVAVAAILILGTMAAAGNAQEGTILPESNFTGNIEETQSGNEDQCFNEDGQLQSCFANPQNGATTQERSNTGNATEEAINPAPLQEMQPAFHITTKQLANGLIVEKPAPSTNVDCNRTVCVEFAPHIPVTAANLARAANEAEQLLGRQTSPPAFILAINGKMVTEKQCSLQFAPQGTQYITVKRDGGIYTICTPNNTNIQVPPSSPLCSQTTIPSKMHTKPQC